MIYRLQVIVDLLWSCVKRHIFKFLRYTARSFIPAGLCSAPLRGTCPSLHSFRSLRSLHFIRSVQQPLRSEYGVQYQLCTTIGLPFSSLQQTAFT